MLSASQARARSRNSSTLSVWSGTGDLRVDGGPVLRDDRVGDALAVLRGRAVQVAVERDPRR